MVVQVGATGLAIRLIAYPPGADGRKHSHPVVGIGFILEGTMISGFDEVPEEIFVTGRSFIDRARFFHRASRNGSRTESMRFVIACSVRDGEPNTVWPQS
jgi:quercetin dioxygenase-like cupin family protein